MRDILRRTAFVLLVAVLLTAATIGVGCSKAKEGQLPTYKVGNTWTLEMSYEGSYYTVTYEITGEDKVNGRDCWVAKITMDPAIMGISSGTDMFDKSTWFTLRSQASGSMMGMPFSSSTTSTFQPSDATYFPLEIGKEVTVTETQTTTAKVAGQETEPKIETITHTYKVEAVEEITVKAGTFKCFKITDGASTIWWSDKAKQEVKAIAEEDGTTIEGELTSYSV